MFEFLTTNPAIAYGPETGSQEVKIEVRDRVGWSELETQRGGQTKKSVAVSGREKFRYLYCRLRDECRGAKVGVSSRRHGSRTQGVRQRRGNSSSACRPVYPAAGWGHGSLQGVGRV
jgi:hypothetical protein